MTTGAGMSKDEADPKFWRARPAQRLCRCFEHTVSVQHSSTVFRMMIPNPNDFDIFGAWLEAF